MEFMSLAAAVKYGTPFLLFSLVIQVVYLLIIVRGLRSAITDIKDNIIWADTLKVIHDGFNDKIKAIEKRIDKLEK